MFGTARASGVTAGSATIGGMENADRIATWSPGPRGPARIYKNRAKGQTKREPGSCLACFPHNVAGQRVPLAYGVSLVLCKAHRDPRFIATRSGRDVLRAVATLFSSLGDHGAPLPRGAVAVRGGGRPAA
jgi:hypothetical protein